MNFKRLLLFLVAPLAIVMGSCTPEEPEYIVPKITITDTEGKEISALNFSAELGDQTIIITATRGWTITESADWLQITPESDTNLESQEKSVEVVVSVLPNEGGPRNESFKVVMDKIEKTITVSQASEGQTALGDVLYYDNIDKDGKQAVKINDKWSTYVDSEAGQAFFNPTPENQAGVTYGGKSVSVRSNSANGSAGQHSNCKEEGSGLNYIWFGTAPTYLTVNNISLSELEGNALTLSFISERYEYNATDNTFNKDEFKVYVSGDGAKWSNVEYTFLEGANLNGKWNIATAQFNLKEVPETLSLYFSASASSAYAIDDIKLTAGGGGTEIDLSQGIELSIEGGGGSTEIDPNAQTISVAEFIEKADTATTYQLTGTISGNVNTQYGNFDLVDESGSIYVYGLVDESGKNIDWTAKGLNKGDVITIQGKYYLYTNADSGATKHEIVDAIYISHTDGENEDPEPPVVIEGDFTSDAAFVCTQDNSDNAAYGLGDTKFGNNPATGFKLGKSKQEGKFTSAAIGVSGDKYLNFYAVSWGAGGDKTIYFRVNGGEIISQAIKADDGAQQNAPYNNITPEATDHYSVKLTGLTESDVIEFSTNAAFDCATTTDYATRAIFFGVKLTDEAINVGGGEGGEEPEQPEQPVQTISVADFIAKADTATTYQLTGTISGDVNTQYGSFDLVDESGSIYVYGLYEQDGSRLDWAAKGLKKGDVITVQGKYYLFTNSNTGATKHEIQKAYYISHTAGESGEEPEQPEQPVQTISVADFIAKADTATTYQLTGTISGDVNTQYGSFDLVDESGSIYVYGLYEQDGSRLDWAAKGLKKGDVITVQGKYYLYTNSNTGATKHEIQKAYYISHTAGEGGEEPEQPEQPELAGTGEGTLESPYDVVRAKAAIDAYETVSGVFVKGIVTATATKYNSTYKSCDYYISVDGTTENELMVYSGKFLDGADFTSGDQIHAGDEVVVCGNLKNYNGTYEFDKTSKIVSLVCNHEGEEPEQPEDPEQPIEPSEGIELPWIETFDGDLSAYSMSANEKGENYIDATNAQLSTAPELMFRFGTYFAATIASDGTAKTLYLTFNANYTDRVSATSTTEGVTVQENGNLSKLASYIVNVPAGLQSFTIVLNNIHAQSNVRIDNIRLAETEYERGLTSIAIAGATDTFAIGSTYEFDGVVNATYDSYETAAVEGYTVDSSAVNTEVAGTYEVTVSYTEGGVTKTASYSVTVKDASSVATYTLTILKEDFPGGSYAANNGEHTKDGVTYITNQMMNQQSLIQWQKNTAYIYNTTSLGKIESITLDGATGGPFTVYAGTTANPTETTITGSNNTFDFSAGEYGFFTIKCGGSTGKCNSITITYTK